MNINLHPTFDGYIHTTTDGVNVMAAYSNFRRQDGLFSGLSLSLQASPIGGMDKPHPDDAEMFYRVIALVNAAPALLEALEGMVELFGGEYGADLETVNAAREALRLATTHPTQDAIEAEQREYEERADARRDYDDDGDDRAYLHGDIDPETLTCAAEFNREVAEGR